MSAMVKPKCEAQSAFDRVSGQKAANDNGLEKKPTPFSMRLTPEERSYLDAHCGGRPWAAYIRECVFGPHAKQRKAVRRPRVEDRELAAMLSELGRSGLSSNLNQLAKSANIGTLDVGDETEQQLQDACDAVLAMREALVSALGIKSAQ